MKHNRLKQVSALFLPGLLFGMLFLSACENDLNKIKEISAKYVSKPIDTTKGVEIIYSDSAIVKGKMNTPVMIHYSYSEAAPYYIMPKGVKVIFYDINAQEDGNIIADSAVYRDVEKRVEFYHHVVYTTAKGDTFKSEELIWDQLKKTMYSTKPVQIVMAGGDVLNGIDFTSDDKLQYPVMKQSTGVFNVSDMPTK
ncbi:LPS export ABC transporter periplasmic protein LptC [Mucilaginibacter sp. UR6-11]|uniref:LPS export ABC transporter periplasmic protein LptC n=1 Tax=Mucilaginibacter sp. UR6-11 TaxID=1435644 RepID=UPI001E528968|nr:LPS export ABC transporter periplasmic protein LptC [Mucilaginibacter sp. UR6-11]MCC8425244.1 LPS export ABC transporter periplasmic protein LptC [Mucilaginibacter sp. UR6-11]